jgi:hypothetical protein
LDNWLEIWRHGMLADLSARSRLIVGLVRLGMMINGNSFNL